MWILLLTIFADATAMAPVAGAQSNSITGAMSGDGVPNGYSVVNVDVDTIEGPTVVDPSVIGYVRNIDIEVTESDKSLLLAVSHLFNQTTVIVEAAISRTKLVRSGFIPSSFVSFGMTGSEPNYGPFPQYNIMFEDQPIEDFYGALVRQRIPNYKSSITGDLENILARTRGLYERLRTAVQGPVAAKNSKAFSASSFYEDHEQFIENNPVPFQEITVHAESAVPAGGDAPAMARSAFKLLDLNRSIDDMTYKLLDTEEKLLIKQLKSISNIFKKR